MEPVCYENLELMYDDPYNPYDEENPPKDVKGYLHRYIKDRRARILRLEQMEKQLIENAIQNSVVNTASQAKEKIISLPRSTENQDDFVLVKSFCMSDQRRSS